MGNCFRCYFRQISISLAFTKGKKDCKILKFILVPDFCPLKTEIARFSIAFRLNISGNLKYTRNDYRNTQEMIIERRCVILLAFFVMVAKIELPIIKRKSPQKKIDKLILSLYQVQLRGV